MRWVDRFFHYKVCEVNKFNGELNSTIQETIYLRNYDLE